jgi:hypothetical protein
MLMVVVLAACGEDSDPHEIRGCFDSWATLGGNPPEQCEAACQGLPSEPGGGMCQIGTRNGGVPDYCDVRLEVEGGCCLRGFVGGLSTIRFQECL